MTLLNVIPPVGERLGIQPRSVMDRMFDDMTRDFFPTPWRPMKEAWSEFIPRVDVKETEKAILVTAELPGVDEKDVEVMCERGVLTIKGEKKSEKEEKKKDYYWTERTFGSFYRTIALPTEVMVDKVEAVFNKGVLTVSLPKSEEAKNGHKKIAIKTSH